MSRGALGQLLETGEKAEVFWGVWILGGGGPVKHGHPATHPGQCAMMEVCFSECMHLTQDTHSMHTSEEDLRKWVKGRRGL